eukprot:3059553-Pyramimonas_sp.AAC.1
MRRGTRCKLEERSWGLKAMDWRLRARCRGRRAYGQGIGAFLSAAHGSQREEEEGGEERGEREK